MKEMRFISRNDFKTQIWPGFCNILEHEKYSRTTKSITCSVPTGHITLGNSLANVNCVSIPSFPVASVRPGEDGKRKASVQCSGRRRREGGFVEGGVRRHLSRTSASKSERRRGCRDAAVGLGWGWGYSTVCRGGTPRRADVLFRFGRDGMSGTLAGRSGGWRGLDARHSAEG